jgi:hypothetical protein
MEYKGYTIEFSSLMSENLAIIDCDDKNICCLPKDLQKVKLLIDNWEYPKEFNKKLEDILSD